MDDFSYLLAVLIVAPLDAVFYYPIIFAVLSCGCIAVIWLVCRPVSGMKWLLFVPLLLAAIWVISLMIVCGLGVPEFAPH
jgi:hypothetical protein